MYDNATLFFTLLFFMYNSSQQPLQNNLLFDTVCAVKGLLHTALV